MRHVVLILAHKDIQLLANFISYFSYGCEIYIHVDKKYVCRQSELDRLRNLACVKFVAQKYKVNWGGYNMLLAEIELLRVSYKEGVPCYYHLFSGADYPLKPLWYFYDTFNHNSGINYIHCNTMHIWHFQERLLQYQPYSLFPDRSNSQKKIRRLVQYQKNIGISRHIGDFPSQMYIGSQWFSITEEAVGMILAEDKGSRRFLKRLNHTFAPEEIYINTLIRNNCPVEKVCNSNLRYIRWTYENGNCPANLDLSHLKYCLASGALFARKFDTAASKDIRKFVDENLLHPHLPHKDDKANFRWMENYFDFDYTAVNIIKKIVKILNVSSVLFPECGSCLYLDALIGNKVPVQGIDALELSEKLAEVFSLMEYFQRADFLEEVECDDTFDMLLIINAYSRSNNLYTNGIVIENIDKLTEKYILIIEREKSTGSENALSKFKDMLRLNGFEEVPYISMFCKLTEEYEQEVVLLERKSIDYKKNELNC